jgi:hypothetical protein
MGGSRYEHQPITAADATFSQSAFRADSTDMDHRRLFLGRSFLVLLRRVLQVRAKRSPPLYPALTQRVPQSALLSQLSTQK